MIKTKLRDLAVGDRFRTLLTNRQGWVELSDSTAEGVLVRFVDELFEVRLHPDVKVELTVN